MRGSLRWAAYWLVIALSVGFSAYVVVHSRSATTVAVNDPAGALPPTPSPTPTPTPVRTTALFVGDGYLATGNGLRARDTFAGQACSTLNWACSADVAAGTGYVTGVVGSSQSQPYPARLAKDRASAPDVVVVTGGSADAGNSTLSGAAAQAYFKAVTKKYPKAQLIVLGPFWNDDIASTSITTLRAAVRAAATADQATWVDTKGWISTSMLQTGGTTLTVAGQKKVAGRLVSELTKAGLA